ncbi:single-stranded DNA-binding protein [Lactobacillus reuteri]|uniref:single-stranded DNA-binding protein n=1 Tax=Limosilactobacillus reuteri TaxID=1598 RepID=UPI00146DBE13|nr:single-stranded DNA-binding protein [Limosilactobacillus reuteri]NMV54022.1 single-stranded DNA-binding protein [Limosilactobacillus reuteri]NMV57466.1 single-stranded DNA-binding protein [Limosilactobacillus reuteri]
MISATIIGRLTRDPEQQQVGQYNVTHFTVASNSTRKNRDGEYDNTFVRCTVFGRQGDVIAQRFQKGQPIIVSGELSTSTWQDKQGQDRTSVEMSVQNFSFTLQDRFQNQSSGQDHVEEVSDDDMPF